MAKTVSYVVTLYNKRDYLAHMLHGLRSQIGDFERQYIFVDDGSTDDTVPLLESLTYDWGDVTLIRQANAGPAIANNRGISIASGDFIKPLDGDDMLAPWASLALLQAMDKTGLPIASGDMAQRAEYDPAIPPQDYVFKDYDEGQIRPETDSLKRSLKSARTTPSSWMAERSIVEQSGGSDERIFIQDYSLELRLARLSSFAKIENAIFAAPRQAEGRMSDNVAQTLHDCNLAVLYLLEDHPELHAAFRRYGMRRAAGRARLWAKRQGKEGAFSQINFAWLKALFGRLPATPQSRKILCAPFRRTNFIRIAPGFE